MSELPKQALDAAVWVTASPHEWVWTVEQQVAMARYCIASSNLLNQLQMELEKIVCTEGADVGVVMLSNDGPTYFDAELNCQVYYHEYFSPLGDALIALHKKIKAFNQPKEPT